MRETSDSVRPLAPAADRPTSSDDEETAAAAKSRRKRLIRCCGSVAVLLLVQAAVIVALIFTVFRVKNPYIQLHGVTVQRLELLNGTTTPRPGSNMTLIADVSVKNPNFASFKYPNTTTTIFYRGTVIGEGRRPPGRERARRTMRMNVTADVIMDRFLSMIPEINSGLLNLSTYTRVEGRVRMIVVNMHVTATLNCSFTLNVTSPSILRQRCRRKFKL